MEHLKSCELDKLPGVLEKFDGMDDLEPIVVAKEVNDVGPSWTF